jgi:hypothetical protein
MSISWTIFLSLEPLALAAVLFYLHIKTKAARSFRNGDLKLNGYIGGTLETPKFFIHFISPN